MKKTSIAIACDHAGLELKQLLKHDLEHFGAVEDLGTHTNDSVDYPDYADKLAAWMEKNKGAKGVLICGSGIGISIAANRHNHIRAALAHDGLSAALSRKHNDANVLALGARLIGIETARDAIKQFFTTEFEGGRHQKRVDKL